MPFVIDIHVNNIMELDLSSPLFKSQRNASGDLGTY